MSDDDLAGLLTAGLDQLGVGNTEPEQVCQLLAYLQLLEQWNKTYSLTAVRDPAEMVTRHVLDSLAVLPWTSEGRLLDAGSGAGLPGIPLAIMRPELTVTLLDSAGKKIRFLNHIKRTLKMANIEAVQQRLESYADEGVFDVIISRAFSDLAKFAVAARHLAANTTRLLAMKGKFPESELSGLPDWIQLNSVEKLTIPGLHEDRHLVIMSV
jgi:16S rRNA (guanine527-N7)-methyltransferase